ncbi:Aste57867_141 [Aphanomyces stellatus]|uniref:Aste57867_141 protein n=1 Tax=Aphanomyces stellatus TaxID=120398 RepID=A0A485K2B1_9STRA|nr:hypothetical protein As57867_000141 [Aphanomyces stellatus]VFT77367.1 Aste57867_141 [Aphanomyces stellatus]
MLSNPKSADMQCKYAYKECYNMRTFKRDGDLHRLCEYHRNKANALQKIYATKRRGELRALKRQLAQEGSTVPYDFVKVEIKVEELSNEEPLYFAVDDDCDIVCLFDESELQPIDVFTTTEVLSDDEYAYLSAVL